MFKGLIVSLLTFASVTIGYGVASAAPEILDADQLNLVKIERKKLILARQLAVTKLVANAKKMEVYLAWTDPSASSKPDAVKDKILPATMYVLGGTAASAALFTKYFPNFLTKLPTSVQFIIKISPAVYAVAQAAFKSYDYEEYKANVAEVKGRSDLAEKRMAEYKTNDLGDNDPLKLYYEYLKSDSIRLSNEIHDLSLQINLLNQRANLYE